MLALVRTPQGQLELQRDYPDPKPAPDELLLQVTHAGICGTDLEILKGYSEFHGVPGHEFTATVLKGPKELKNKRVVAEINCPCSRCDMCQSGLANHCRNRTVLGIAGRDGAFAQLLAVPQRNVYPIPDSLSDDQAVFVEPLAAALQIVKQTPIESRDRCLVLGDGPLGLLAVQVLANAAKKGNVLIVGKHPDKLLFAEKRGIQGLHLSDLHVKPEYDLVVDCTGSADGFQTAAHLVRPRGRLVLKSTIAGGGHLDLSPLVVNEILLIGSRCGPFPDAINALAAHQIETNGLISARFPLADAPKALQTAQNPQNLKVLLDM